VPEQMELSAAVQAGLRRGAAAEHQKRPRLFAGLIGCGRNSQRSPSLRHGRGPLATNNCSRLRLAEPRCV
jgi:hypothetical protein